MKTPHDMINPADLPPPSGYSHAVVARPGRIVHIAGQIGSGVTLLEQFDNAAARVVSALRAASSQPEHVVSMTVYVTDVAAYRAARPALRAVWRAHFGDHYPAMAVIGVSELVDPAAMVELMAVAVTQ